MKSKKLFFYAILSFIFIINNFTCAYNQVVDLGQGSARSINDSGQIVGGSNSNGRAYLFDRTGNGANIDLGAGTAYSINNSGLIVGSSGGSASGYACVFDSTGNGNNTELGQYSGNTLSYGTAYSVNNSSKMAGEFHYSGGSSGACIFNSPFLKLGNSNRVAYPLNDSSRAFAINDSGQVAGSASFKFYNSPPLTPTYYHACLFDQTGGGANIDLGALGVYNASTALSINNSGQIVGRAYYTSNFVYYSRACLFDSTGNGNNIDLGALDNYTNSGAQAINDIGQIVGYAVSSSGSHACLFDSTGGGANLDLNMLIDPSSGWTLTYAYDISNNGWIVGQGTLNGQDHAFLLEVPEPATILLISLGGLALRKKH
jgi:uncharacterized membrane protein